MKSSWAATPRKARTTPAQKSNDVDMLRESAEADTILEPMTDDVDSILANAENNSGSTENTTKVLAAEDVRSSVENLAPSRKRKRRRISPHTLEKRPRRQRRLLLLFLLHVTMLMMLMTTMTIRRRRKVIKRTRNPSLKKTK